MVALCTRQGYKENWREVKRHRLAVQCLKICDGLYDVDACITYITYAYYMV